MTRIADCFQSLRAKGERALIVYLTVGDPDYETSAAMARAILDAGADILELGIAFSDPLADGPVIQAASKRALDGGTIPEHALKLAEELRPRYEAPLIAFTYFNPIMQFGVERFAKEAAAAGIDAALITDLPPDQADEWRAAAQAHHLDTIFLLAPTSTDDRIQLVVQKGSGFIYCVSRTGVTGMQDSLPIEAVELVNRTRAQTDMPVAVGFGISHPDHVRAVCRVADGAVVGSAVVRLISEGKSPQELGAFVARLKEATR